MPFALKKHNQPQLAQRNTLILTEKLMGFMISAVHSYARLNLIILKYSMRTHKIA